MIAEDIVQNTFLKLYEKIDEIRILGSANFWLFKSARNEYFNFYRKNKRNVEFSEEIEEDKDSRFELEEYIETKDLRNLVLNKLSELPAEQKEVYLLKEYGGLSYKEIAETTGIEINLVKSRLYKTRQKLINKISKLV